jgi:hypothetical protein
MQKIIQFNLYLMSTFVLAWFFVYSTGTHYTQVQFNDFLFPIWIVISIVILVAPRAYKAFTDKENNSDS